VKALRIVTNGVLCLDDADQILQEYRGYLSPSGQPGIGDFFLKWLFHNQWNERYVARIHIDPVDGSFEQFPDDQALEGFDRDDRKFVAVALSSEETPTILNATDSDWWEFRAPLEAHGIRIEFMCPELMPA
jgi:hypothetical protein